MIVRFVSYHIELFEVGTDMSVIWRAYQFSFHVEFESFRNELAQSKHRAGLAQIKVAHEFLGHHALGV